MMTNREYVEDWLYTIVNDSQENGGVSARSVINLFQMLRDEVFEGYTQADFERCFEANKYKEEL